MDQGFIEDSREKKLKVFLQPDFKEAKAALEEAKLSMCLRGRALPLLKGAIWFWLSWVNDVTMSHGRRQ
jgi:hypothetical protein